jgi:2',3'-cyclic-nucleotide 2'-phosphodiesterase (5'-nucleotidase family)/DNA-binding beta-propeller fold protein YncE
MTPTIALLPLGTFETGILDESAAEIVAYDPVSYTLYVVNGEDDTVDVIDITDPTAPARIRRIDLSAYGDGPNSCDFHPDTPAGGLLAVAVEGEEVDEPGTAAFFDRDGDFVYSATLGVLPDMVTFTPDGGKVLVANEGEPNDEYTVDPEGSVSIVTVGAMSATVETADFTGFNGQKQALMDSGVRIFGGVDTFAVTAYSDTDPATLTLDGDVEAAWENGWLTIYTGDDPIVYRIAGVVTETDLITLTTDFDSDTDLGVLTDTGTVNIHTGRSTVAQDLEPEYIAVSPDGSMAWVTLQENNAVAVIDVASSSVVTVTALGFKDHSLAGNGLDANDEDEGINITTWPILGMYQPDAIASYEAGGNMYYITANEGDSREYDHFNEEVGIDDLVLDSGIFSSTLQEEENLGELATTTTLGDTDGDGEFEAIYAYGARSFSIWGCGATLVYDSGDDLEQLTAARHPKDFNADNDENDSFDKRSDNKGPEPEAIATGVVDGRTYAFIGLERLGGIVVYDVTDPTAPFLVWYVNTRQFGGDAEAGTAGDLGPEGLKFISAADSPTRSALLAVANEVSGSTTIYEITQDIPYRLTVLHTNDFHGRVDDWESWGSIYGGSARIAMTANQFRAAQDNVLLLDAGDQFQGTLYYRLFKADIVTITMNALGYDAMAIGNHEFDDGPSELARLIDGAEFPVLSANIDASAEPLLAGKIAPSAVLTVSGEPIGVVGLTTPETENISSPGDNVVFNDPAASVQPVIDDLTAQGIDKIMGLTHLGYNEAVALAEAVTGLDVIVGGHSHTYLHTGDEDAAGPYPTVAEASDGNPVLIVSANEWGKYLGYLDVTFAGDGTVSHFSGYPLLMDDSVAQDPAIQSIITPTYKVPVEELMNTYVGTTTLELPLSVGGERICRTGECLLGNLVTDAMLWKVNTLDPDNPYDIAFQNGGGLRAGIDAGPVSVGEVLEVLPFGNTMATFEITGTHLMDALESGVSKLGGTSGTGRFPQVAGMRFTLEPDAQIGSRILSAEVLSGTSYVPLDEDTVYKVVTNNHIRGGGDGYDAFEEFAINPYDGGPPLEDAVMDYLSAFSPVTPVIEGRIVITHRIFLPLVIRS